jgi:hypothetical protein
VLLDLKRGIEKNKNKKVLGKADKIEFFFVLLSEKKFSCPFCGGAIKWKLASK